MQIAVYGCDDAPKGFGFVAHIITEQPGQPGKPWALGFHPVVFRAETAEEVRKIAQTWWTDETEKARKRVENTARQSERMRKRAG